jgi:hypothetical protein
MSENGTKKNGKEAIGYIPESKIGSIIGSKLWDEHRRNSEALSAARDLASQSKDKVRKQIAKALKLSDDIDWHLDNSGKLRVVKAKPKQEKVSKAVDLTAA